jgi:hypothetical protein
MKARILAFALVAVALGAFAVPMFAHHSFAAEFDSSKKVNLTGVITQVKWQNPHVYFYIDVKDPVTGKVTNYACEMGSPNAISSNGLVRDFLKVGMVASLSGSMAKDGTAKLNAGSVTINGKPYNAASSEGVTP